VVKNSAYFTPTNEGCDRAESIRTTAGYEPTWLLGNLELSKNVREDLAPWIESNVHICSQRVNRTTTDCGPRVIDPLGIVVEAQKWGGGRMAAAGEPSG
jgi:hypothetical protein